MNECCNNNVTIKSFEYVYHLEKDNYLSEFKTEEEKARVRHNLGLTEGNSETERINPVLLDSGFTSEVLDAYVVTDENEKLTDKITQKIYDLVGEETIEEDDKTLKERVQFSYDKAKLVDGLNTSVQDLEDEIEFINKIKTDYYQEEEDGDFIPKAPTERIEEGDENSEISEDKIYSLLKDTEDIVSPDVMKEIINTEIDDLFN